MKTKEIILNSILPKYMSSAYDYGDTRDDSNKAIGYKNGFNSAIDEMKENLEKYADFDSLFLLSLAHLDSETRKGVIYCYNALLSTISQSEMSNESK